MASAAYRFQARIVVHAPLAEVQERTSARSVVLSAIDDETTLLEAGAETLYGLAFHLSFLGWEFEVEEPAELRTALAEMGGRALRAAGTVLTARVRSGHGWRDRPGPDPRGGRRGHSSSYAGATASWLPSAPRGSSSRSRR